MNALPRVQLVLALTTLSIASAFFACGHKRPRVQEPVQAPADAGSDSDTDAADAAPTPTLYDRIGGRDGVAGIIDSFMSNVAADKRLKKAFGKTTGPKLDHFKEMFADQVCSLAGGSCTYTGKGMKEAHQGMGVSEAQWNAFIEDLTYALEEKQVSKDDQKDLLDKLTAMKDDVVEKKDKK